MSKSIRKKIKLLSTFNSGHFYTTTKNKKNNFKKIKLKKYDPIICQYILYKEGKIN